MTQANRVSLIGVGSPFGADRIGWLMVEALERGGLAARFPQLSIQFEQSDRPGSRLIGLLNACDCAVILDAMQSGAPAGTVHRFSLDELTAEAMLVSSHGFGVMDALALAGRLGVLPESVVVIGVEMGDETEAESLAEKTAGMVEVAVRDVLSMCRQATRIHDT